LSFVFILIKFETYINKVNDATQKIINF